MVRFTAPKRTNKNVTIEEYNAEKERRKEKFRKNTGPAPVTRYVNIDRRFRYLKPTQKLKQIDVNVAHYINEIRTLPYSHDIDSIGSFFYDELENAKFQDLTPEFQEFYAEILDISQNLALILYNLERIVNIMLQYLDKKDCRKTILQIFPGLFRDTQKDIFKLFLKKILPKLIEILNSKDLDILEDLFKCLAYALRFLYDEIKANFQEFYTLYIEKFFSSRNIHIQRFTTESLSFVIRKLKGSEIESYIHIVMNPLLTVEGEQETSLLVEHIAKLIFYSIKNPQETYTSKSLVVVENMLKFTLNNRLEDSVRQCILQFIHEILTHSRPKEDTFKDEFQEKINISKSNLFEHFIKVFLQWVGGITDVAEHASKIQLICEIFTEMLTYRKGILVNQTLFKIIFSVVKELDTIYNAEMVDEETQDILKRANFIVIAKILKYKEADLLEEKDYVRFIDEKVRRGSHNNELVNLFFEKITEEIEANIPYREYMSDADFLAENYTLRKYSYDILLNLILQSFSWSQIVHPDASDDSSVKLLNLYFFSIIHKYSNRKNKIILQNEKYRISQETHQALLKLAEQLLIPLLESSTFKDTISPQYTQNYTRLLLFTKYLDIFEILPEDKKALESTMVSLNEKFQQKLKEQSSLQLTDGQVNITAQDLYKLPNSLRKQFEYYGLKKGQETFNLRELLLILKGEIISKIGTSLGAQYGNNLEHLDSIIQKEFQFLLNNRNHIYYLKNFSHFLDEILDAVNAASNINKDALAPAFAFSSGKIQLSLEKYGKYLDEFTSNLSNPASDVRRYTLEILTKIQVYNFPPPDANIETKIVGECDALLLCLEIESTDVKIETERIKTINFTTLRTYTDFKRLPTAYILPLMNFYIGSLYVRLTTLWEHAKGNLASLLKLNSKKIYPELRKHILYLNNLLNPRVEPMASFDRTIEAASFNGQQEQERAKYILDMFLEDHHVKMEHVHQEDVFKNLFEAVSRHTKIVEFNAEDFYSIFLNFLEQEYYKTFENESVAIDIKKIQAQAKAVQHSEENLLQLCYKEALEANKEKDNLFKKCRHFGNLKLESFLKVFINFQKLKSLENSNVLYDLLMSFLRKGHVTIQKNALDCLIKYEKQEIVEYADEIKKFIKPESYRDQMIQFKLDKETSVLTESQRKIVVPIIIGALFPKLFEQKGRDRKSHMESNRTMVFIFFSNLDESEIHYLISILFRNHGLPWENIENVSLEALMVHMSKLSLEKVSAFLENLKNLIDQLGVILCPYLPNISKLINAAVKLSTMMRKKYTSVVKGLKARASQEGVELTEEEEVLVRLLGKWKNVYQAALKRVAQIYTKYSGWDFGNEITVSLMDTLKENILNLYVDSSSNISLLLKVLVVWSKHRVYLDYFLQFKEIFPSVVKIYAQTKAKSEVLSVVDQILASICGFAHPSKGMEVEAEDEQNDEVEDVKEEGAKKAQQILSDNVDYTISCIKVYFEYQMSLSKHKVWRPSLKMTKNLVHLSEFVQESTLCNDLLGLLQPLIDAQYINKAYDKRRKRDDTNNHVADRTVETLVGVLKTFVNFFKHSSAQERFYHNVLNLLSELYVNAPRKSVVEMVLNLQQEKFNLSTKAIVYIEVLNKYSRLSHRELDYGAVSSACIDINEQFLATCSFEDQQLLLTQYFFLLTQDELSLRMSAVAGFKQFFELIRDKIVNKDASGVHKEIGFVTGTLVPKAIKGLKSSDEYQVKGNLDLLDMYIHYMSDYKKKGLNLDNFDGVYYLDLKVLQNKTDLPQDFFENIFDVQNYKRVKAVNILTKKLNAANNQEENTEKQTEEISLTSLRNIILPVLRFQILDKSQQENVLKSGGSQVTHAKTLVANMIEAYSLCLKNFSWTQYFNVLKTNITTLNKSAKYEKVMVRLICSNLNYLDGGLPNIVEEVTKEMKSQENTVSTDSLMNKLVTYDPNKAKEADDFEEKKDPKKVIMGKFGKQQKKKTEGGMETEEPEETKKNETMEVEAANLTEEEQNKIKEEKNRKLTQTLRKKVLVPLRKHMHDLAAQDNKEKKIRVYTAIAIAKLVCRFPFNMFNIEFPRLLHNISESLKSRDFDIRNNARKALTEIALITGPYFFHYIVNELNSVLTLGYTQHVKNYTLYYLIQSMIHPKNEQTAQKVEIGSFDYCLNSILPVFADEILGKLQEEKEVEEIKSKIPEFRTSKAFEAFNLLASVIDVKKSFVYLINFVRTQLQECSNMQKKCNKIEEILRQITEGVTKNPSLDVELVLIICFYLIEQSLETMMIKDTPDLNEFTLQEYSLSKDELKKYDVQRTFLIQEGAASGKSIFKLMAQNQKKNVFMVGRIIASFSINLILMCIKKSLIKPGNKEDPQQQAILSKFEPLTKLIINCIKSNENSVITGSIKILNKIATWPLNSLQKNYKKIVSSALTVLESLSMTDYDMIRVCFKLIGNVFQIPTAIQLANNQIKALLQYIDQFMFVSDHIGDVIDCLNTMVQKKVVRPEVYDLMDKIIESMITSNSVTLQKSCKNAFLSFLVEYPMSEKLIKKYIQLFIKNLDYPNEQGRGVVIDILARVVEALPIELLHNYFDLILYTCILKSIAEEDRELKNNLRRVGQNLLRRIPQEKTPEYIQNFLSWLGDSKEGVVQAGLEGFLHLILQGARVEKHFKVVLDKLEAGLNQIVHRIEQYWQSQREEYKREKEKSRIQSKFLKKLREENEEDINIPIEENESLGETLLRVVEAFVEKQPGVLTKYINNENKEFMKTFLSLVTFPKERFVVDCLGVAQILLEKIGGNMKSIFPDASTVMENIGYKLVALFKLSFATNDFEKGIAETVLKSYSLISEDERDGYTVLILHKFLKTLLKMMGSANLNALRIKRIITFVDTLEKSSRTKTILTGNVLKSFIDIVVRIENIKDMFVGENDISQLVTELLDNINKKSETNEFIKVYSSSKVKLQELKEERKIKAKEEVILNPEQALKEKLRRKLKKKEARKGVFGAAGKKFKKLKIQQ